MKKIKKAVRKLNEKPKWFQYMVLALINVVFYALMYIPCLLNPQENTKPVICLVLYIAWLGYALSYGFFSMEIADSLIIGNLMVAVFGGLYCLLGGNEILKLYEGTSVAGEFFTCLWYSIRYSIGAFAVGFVVKNTR
jgi:hypothetical protein